MVGVHGAVVVVVGLPDGALALGGVGAVREWCTEACVFLPLFPLSDGWVRRMVSDHPPRQG